jgi:hypothetical protein
VNTSAKVAPEPTSLSKSNKRVSFAVPIASILGEPPTVECEIHNIAENIVASDSCFGIHMPFVDPMLDEFFLFDLKGAKENKMGNTNSGSRMDEGTVLQTTMTVSTHNASHYHQTESAGLMIELPSVTNSVELEGGACSEDITVEPRLKPLAPVSVTEKEDGLVCNIDGRASVLGCITEQALSVSGNGIANPESTPVGVGELLSEGGQSVTAPNLFTPLAGQNLEAVFREADGSSHELELSAPLSVEAVQTPQVTSSNQEQNPTENDDNIDPMETFLNSITTPLEQPLLPNPEPILYPDQGEADEEIVTDQNQRKNTCLANKAKSRVGKNVTELAWHRNYLLRS